MEIVLAVETFFKGVLTGGAFRGTFFLCDLVPLLVRFGPKTGAGPAGARGGGGGGGGGGAAWIGAEDWGWEGLRAASASASER